MLVGIKYTKFQVDEPSAFCKPGGDNVLEGGTWGHGALGQAGSLRAPRPHFDPSASVAGGGGISFRRPRVRIQALGWWFRRRFREEGGGGGGRERGGVEGGRYRFRGSFDGGWGGRGMASGHT